MMANLGTFFPRDTNVLALPNWHNPRLCLPAQHFIQRWDDSSLYPASRFLARLYRLSLRMKAATGLAETRRVRSGGWPLGDFIREALPQATSVVTLVGTPGPAQKITAQIRCGRGEVLGYLKYAEKAPARNRLRHERHVLHNLPGGVGPRLMKFGPLGKGEALLTSALSGDRLPVTLPPSARLTDLCRLLAVSPPVALETHPWIVQIREREGQKLDPWLEVLARKEWPVVVQHGDFAPWNMLQRTDGTLGVIDWEYGTLEGFPHLDLAYYLLQVSALIYRRTAITAAEYTADYLTGQAGLELDREEAEVLTRLAAYDAYLKSREDGQPDGNDLQAWRREVWKSNVVTRA